MAVRSLWITDEPWPASDATIAAAQAAGATEVLHGIPASLAETIPLGTTGYVELSVDTVAPAAPDPLHQLAQAIVDATTLDDVKPTALAILEDGQ